MPGTAIADISNRVRSHALLGASLLALLTCLCPAPAGAQFTNPRLEAELNAPFNDPHLNLNMFGSNAGVLAQTGTILPTDIVPLPAPHEGQGFGNVLQFRTLQRLPSKFYLNAINETSFRLETNPYQFPNSRAALQQNLTRGVPISSLPAGQQVVINSLLNDVNATQQVFRELPNLTAGWAFTENTRAYANYFLLRDSLFHSVQLNTTIQSVGGGLQHDFILSRDSGNNPKTTLQVNGQFRELYQTNMRNVFDYLPAATLSRRTKHGIAYLNALLQLRGLEPFAAPTREIDPFYTIGYLWSRGRWQIATAATFLQNWRSLFGQNALVPVNNSSWILDFEIDRQLFRRYSGLQAFVRAEPLWNFGSHNAPGFSGFDFRLFYGIRATVGKPALNKQIRDLKQYIDSGDEAAPPKPLRPLTPSTTGPASFLFDPSQIASQSPGDSLAPLRLSGL